MTRGLVLGSCLCVLLTCAPRAGRACGAGAVAPGSVAPAAPPPPTEQAAAGEPTAAGPTTSATAGGNGRWWIGLVVGGAILVTVGVVVGAVLGTRDDGPNHRATGLTIAF